MLVLDEATSALDAVSEDKILERGTAARHDLRAGRPSPRARSATATRSSCSSAAAWSSAAPTPSMVARRRSLCPADLAPRRTRMNAPVSTAEALGSARPRRSSARLDGCSARRASIAVVLDGAGNPGPLQFLASLPEGAAVFALGGTRCPLHAARAGSPSPKPLIGNAAPDDAAIDAWYEALLGAPGMPHGDADTEPIGAGREPRACRRRLRHRRGRSSGSNRQRRSCAIPPPAAPRRRPRDDAPGARRPDPRRDHRRQRWRRSITTTLLAGSSPLRLVRRRCRSRGALPSLSARATPIGVSAGSRRDDDRRDQAAHALKGLRDVAAFRPTAPILLARPARTRCPACSVLAACRGLRASDAIARPGPHPAVRAAEGLRLCQRLPASARSACRQLGGAGKACPSSLSRTRPGSRSPWLCRGRRWHVVDPETLGETAVEATLAAASGPWATCSMPPLPDKPSSRDIWRFSTYGVRGDIVALLIAVGRRGAGGAADAGRHRRNPGHRHSARGASRS